MSQLPVPVPVPGPEAGGLLNGLLRFVAGLRSDADLPLITSCYDVADRQHRGQRRRSGDPYITHPVAVAMIVAGLGGDDQMVCAALLHDVIEDTACTMTALRGEFGAEIADLVAATMTLDAAASGRLAGAAARGHRPAERRALMIKLADRLHNMRTLSYLPRATQVRKSRQTLAVLVPVARALQVHAVGLELEDLASATLRRHRRPPGTSGQVLSVTAGLLPPAARARWRAEWLAELHVLPTRRPRVRFVAQTLRGILRLAVTLRRR
jgi:(p)ppGpp synthase/HD superfamily hydrolase